MICNPRFGGPRRLAFLTSPPEGTTLPMSSDAVLKQKGDFTAGLSLVRIAVMALAVGAACAVVALVLLRLIDFFTNLFYFQRLSFDPASPAGNKLGALSILVPAVGGLIIGLMARFGSDRIRGHGIPEALEAILIGRSRMSPKVAVLKPVSSAISIGSGGPFGAEGPIIMTGGACGSLLAQAFHLTAAERKTLLVAGAAGGMTATFGTPVAAVLLAVELLLFELKPRSLVPVALACTVAAALRPFLLEGGSRALFQQPGHAPLALSAVGSSAVVGLAAGVVALVLTLMVYAMEDWFHRLPIHWMWWPVLGGLVVGLGGMTEPRALGVGKDVIEDLLGGNYVLGAMLALGAVKCVIWATALGSGTSGGVLAPLLIMGGIAGAAAGAILPGGDPQLWTLVGMASVMGGTMRSPLTGAVFALELTRDINALPALLTGSIIAYGFTVLVMKRSILTEKVARRGYHISREYAVDPLERVTAGEVMTAEVLTVPAKATVRELLRDYFLARGRRHQAYPVVDGDGTLLGVITRANLLEDWVAGGDANAAADLVIAYDLVHRPPITIFPWESCRTAAERMAAAGVGRLPVVDADQPRRVVGMLTRSDLLKPRARMVEEEMVRERFFGPGKLAADEAAGPAG
jgi:chloride channel protein, CIC family